MERSSKIPRFFTGGQHGACSPKRQVMTLAMTFVGCLIGFGLAFVLVYLRQTPGLWALPLRARLHDLCRNFPAHTVPRRRLSGPVLHPDRLPPNASLFTIAVIAICIYAIAYTADIIRGGIESVPQTQVEAAKAMNFALPHDS
jgi:polar amino acid transport system permease protein